MLPSLLAQTPDIQEEVERMLWWLRFWESARGVTSEPMFIVPVSLLFILLVIALVVWLWTRQRKHEEADPGRTG
jgi:hypothetical protein